MRCCPRAYHYGQNGLSGLKDDTLVSDARRQRVQQGQGFDDVEAMLRQQTTRNVELVDDGL